MRPSETHESPCFFEERFEYLGTRTRGARALNRGGHRRRRLWAGWIVAMLSGRQESALPLKNRYFNEPTGKPRRDRRSQGATQEFLSLFTSGRKRLIDNDSGIRAFFVLALRDASPGIREMPRQCRWQRQRTFPTPVGNRRETGARRRGRYFSLIKSVTAREPRKGVAAAVP